MPHFSHKIITDPVHGLIRFDLHDKLDSLAWELIQTREFQRLRQIQQQGCINYIYPSAMQTRFIHCVGAFHLTRKFLSILKKYGYVHGLETRGYAVAIATLLHDVGHGPLSHVFESISKDMTYPFTHESWTKKIIASDTEVRAVLKSHNPELIDIIFDFFNKEPAKQDIYSTILSSQFDADRLDYIVRDRLMSGIEAGNFDSKWLLACLEIGPITFEQGKKLETRDVFLFNKHGIYSAIEYFNARNANRALMINHRAVRSLRIMLKELFDTLHENILNQRVDPKKFKSGVLDILARLKNLWVPKRREW